MSLKITTQVVTLRELCLEKLREAIYTGYFPSGTRLIERQLCDDLGVSRSVVREVIRYLEAEGLIEQQLNKGPIVALLNWDIASQIYAIRLQLEQSAVAACIENLTPKIVQDLQKCLQRLTEAFEKDSITELLQASSDFYEIIFLTAGHVIAWEIVQRLNGRINRLRAMTMKSKDRDVMGYNRVKKICEAICVEKDAVTARAAVYEHIKEASGVAYRILENHQL